MGKCYENTCLRSFTGLNRNELCDIYENYLKKYEKYFRTFSALECFNALLIYLRNGVSVQMIAGMMFTMTDRHISVDQLGKILRKVLFLLGKLNILISISEFSKY